MKSELMGAPAPWARTSATVPTSASAGRQIDQHRHVLHALVGDAQAQGLRSHAAQLSVSGRGVKPRNIARRTMPPRSSDSSRDPRGPARRRGAGRGRPRIAPPKLQTTTLWYHPSAQYTEEPMGLRGYEGATPPWVVWNLLERYTREKDLVVDPFCGGGTTLDVARDLGRRGLGYDLNPQREDIFRADARELPLEDEKADFVFMDPPYSTHVDYSERPALHRQALGVRRGVLRGLRGGVRGGGSRPARSALPRRVRVGHLGQEARLRADRNAARGALDGPLSAHRPHRRRARQSQAREAERSTGRRPKGTSSCAATRTCSSSRRSVSGRRRRTNSRSCAARSPRRSRRREHLGEALARVLLALCPHQHVEVDERVGERAAAPARRASRGRRRGRRRAARRAPSPEARRPAIPRPSRAGSATEHDVEALGEGLREHVARRGR